MRHTILTSCPARTCEPVVWISPHSETLVAVPRTSGHTTGDGGEHPGCPDGSPSKCPNGTPLWSTDDADNATVVAWTLAELLGPRGADGPVEHAASARADAVDQHIARGNTRNIVELAGTASPAAPDKTRTAAMRHRSSARIGHCGLPDEDSMQADTVKAEGPLNNDATNGADS
jgi:hypothetical protein